MMRKLWLVFSELPGDGTMYYEGMFYDEQAMNDKVGELIRSYIRRATVFHISPNLDVQIQRVWADWVALPGDVRGVHVRRFEQWNEDAPYVAHEEIAGGAK